MQCTNCGKELTSEDRFCNNCGTQVAEPTFEVPLVSQEEVNNVLRPVEVAPSVEVEAVVEAAPTVEVAPVVEPAPVVEQPAPAFEVQQPVMEAPVVEQPVVEQPVVAPAESILVAPVVQAEPVQEVQHVDVQSHFDTSTGIYDGTPGVEIQETTRLNDATLSVATSNESGVASIPLGNNNLDTEKIEVNTNYGPAPIVDPPVETLQADSYVAGKPKKGFPIPALVAIVVVISFFFGCGGLFIGSKLLNKGTTPTEGDNPGGPALIAEYTTVNFQGNRFDIPLEYDYSVNEDKLSIYNNEIYYYVQVVGTGYANYASNISYVKQSYVDIGYTVKKAEEISVADTKYIVLHLVTPKKENVTMFIRPFTQNQSIVCAIGKSDHTYASTNDYKMIEGILSSSQTSVKRDFELEDNPETDEIFSVIINAELPGPVEEVTE